VKPRERPYTPNPNDRPRKYPDENKWLWEMIEMLRSSLNSAIEPLDRYMKAFQMFKGVLQMNPDEEARIIEMDETPWEVEQLKDEILKMQKLENELKDQIPDVITVSIFQVQCKEIKAYLCEKYYMMSK
jgi:dynein heavy chain